MQHRFVSILALAVGWRNFCARYHDAVTSLRFVEGTAPVNHQDKMAENIDLHDPRIVDSIARYWRKNMLIMVLLLIIWAVVGLGCGVLLADRLNHFALGGFPLGFWFAQQGSIIVFILLILAYCVLLNRLDSRHALELQEYRAGGPQTPDNKQQTTDNREKAGSREKEPEDL
jgi:putative solute:sodium symporter small subunit